MAILDKAKSATGRARGQAEEFLGTDQQGGQGWQARNPYGPRAGGALVGAPGLPRGPAVLRPH